MTSLPTPTSPTAFAALAKRLDVEMSSPPTIGDQIAVYIKARGFTQAKLAELMGVAQPRVAEAIRGENITSERLQQFADALDVALVVLPGAANGAP